MWESKRYTKRVVVGIYRPCISGLNEGNGEKEERRSTRSTVRALGFSYKEVGQLEGSIIVIIVVYWRIERYSALH